MGLPKCLEEEISKTTQRIDTVLAMVVPCFNEQDVIPQTIPALLDVLDELIRSGLCSQQSFLVFVDDGSGDETWQLLLQATKNPDRRVHAIRLANNSGHQNALLAGLDYVTERADASVSIDADLQDDLGTIKLMVMRYQDGDEVVLGVRSDRTIDRPFKRITATLFYRFMQLMGVDAIPQHADFRLLSQNAMRNLAKFPEYNVYLRGFMSVLHSRTSVVKYVRGPRLAGETKYPLGKMLALAWNGITSFSVVPLRLIGILGGSVFVIATVLSLYAIFARLGGNALPGWASVTAPLYALGGMIMLSIGVVGEYVGKIYLEVKRRPRYLLDQVEPSDE